MGKQRGTRQARRDWRGDTLEKAEEATERRKAAACSKKVSW